MSKRQSPDPQASQLQELQRRAEAMTRGDFSALGQPVGGTREVEDLRRALDVMGTHVEQAQSTMQGYIAALTTAQEAERGRIARELHDDTVQRLIALGQGLERAQRLAERNPAQAVERLGTLRSDITSMVQAVRTLIGDLRPPALEELGLLPAIKLLIGRSGGDLPEVRVEVQGVERRLAPQSELALFRILQEAWNNIRRHAQAQHVAINFDYAPDALHVTLADDGQGFVPASDGGQRGRWGLIGMQERAGLVGGLVQVASEPGTGTRVKIHMPYPGVDDRDPICGMDVGPDAICAEYGGTLYRFCSEACRELFLAAPEQYI